jgi:hypothetical protein
MASPVPQEPGELGQDYSFLVTDEDGVEHELGPLVNRVVSLRRRHRDEAGDGDIVTPVDIGTIAAVELGIQIAIGTLFGEDAREAFAEHCRDIERFLQESDTARH